MISIGDKILSSEDFYKVVFYNEKLVISEDAIKNIEKTYNFLKEFLNGKIIYGINTGLGPMAQYKVNSDKTEELQKNLIRSHANGIGDTISPLYIKAIMLSRLNSLSKGYSGIHLSAIELLTDMINDSVFPVIYEHGGVGASGDLVQLAHIALSLIGEGQVFYHNKIHNTSAIFKQNKLKPLKIHIREGLALLNGTSAMSGIGMVNLFHARNLLDWSLVASAMINEIVESYNDHFSSELNRLKNHRGQIKVARTIRRILNGSKLVRQRADHFYNNGHNEDSWIFKEKVQEFYSIRCIPQILGPVADTIEFAENILIDEVNSVNDNPVVDADNSDVYHGGNFHGDYVSLEMDKLKIAITKLSMLSERQLNFLMNDKLNGKLPPFLNLGVLGLNFGLQGMQFSAVSTVAENQTLSYPMYVHSIPSNNDNQDIVSMGTNSALLTMKVIENSYQVMAIEMIALAQAIDYLDIKSKLSKYSFDIFSLIRTIIPKFEKDEPRYKEIELLKDKMISTRLNLNNL